MAQWLRLALLLLWRGVQTLACELPHAMGVAKKKTQKTNDGTKRREFIRGAGDSLSGSKSLDCAALLTPGVPRLDQPRLKGSAAARVGPGCHDPLPRVLARMDVPLAGHLLGTELCVCLVSLAGPAVAQSMAFATSVERNRMSRLSKEILVTLFLSGFPSFPLPPRPNLQETCLGSSTARSLPRVYQIARVPVRL